MIISCVIFAQFCTTFQFGVVTGVLLLFSALTHITQAHHSAYESGESYSFLPPKAPQETMAVLPIQRPLISTTSSHPRTTWSINTAQTALAIQFIKFYQPSPQKPIYPSEKLTWWLMIQTPHIKSQWSNYRSRILIPLLFLTRTCPAQTFHWSERNKLSITLAISSRANFSKRTIFPAQFISRPNITEAPPYQKYLIKTQSHSPHMPHITDKVPLLMLMPPQMIMKPPQLPRPSDKSSLPPPIQMILHLSYTPLTPDNLPLPPLLRLILHSFTNIETVPSPRKIFWTYKNKYLQGNPSR